MKFAYYIKNDSLCADPRIDALLGRLDGGGAEVYRVRSAVEILPSTDGLLSLGGDGTFLMASKLAVQADIPILGVNFGRLGFLSEALPEELPQALVRGELRVEERELLQVLTDGLLVATSSGSTADSLSVGGPICTPDSKVFIVAPISPHNLNVRPLVVPQTTRISISLRSREERAMFSIDNRNRRISAGTRIIVSEAPVRLKRLCSGRSSFINALRTRLLWGEDVRNGNESR